MNPKEFITKRFETNYPELVELIETWAEHSIKQNWDELCVLLNRHTVSGCPPSEWSEELKGNKEYLFLKEITDKVAEYLFAKGYTWVGRSYGGSLISPDEKHMSGHIVRARMVTEEDKKQ